MNKKFSTLMASLLLAGGMFSTANASDWKTDGTYVQNTGKYFVIEQTAEITGIGGTETTTGYFNGYYLTYDANGTLVFAPSSRAKDKHAYWTVTTRTNGGNVEYQLKNAEGKTLSYTYTNSAGDDIEVSWFLVGHTTATSGGVTKDANVLKFYDTDGNLQFLTINAPDVNGNYPFEISTIESACFDNVEIAEVALSSTDLNSKWSDGFYLNFKDYESLEGNVFSTKLTAIPTGVANQYYFQNPETKQYIVLTDEVWSDNTTTLDGQDRSAYAGYKFETISEHAFAQKTNNGLNVYDNAVFTVYKSYDFNDTDSLIVTMPKAKVGKMTSILNLGSECPGVRVFVSTVNKNNYVTVIEYDKANDRLAKQQANSYPVDASGIAYEVGALAPYIEFGQSNIVDFKNFGGKVWNICEAETGQVLTPSFDDDIDGWDEAFAPSEQFDLNKPEGQWLPYYDISTGRFSFVNRESGAKWNVNNGYWVLRSTDTPNVYEAYNYSTNWKGDQVETLIITEAANTKLGKRTELGYAKYDADEESLNGKYLSFETTLGTAYIGKDIDDNVVLTTNKDEAIEFRVKQLTHDFENHDGGIGVDTLRHYTSYSYVKDNEWKSDGVDTLQFYHYALYDHFSEKYLKYDSNAKMFVLSDEDDWNPANNEHEEFDLNAADYAFIIKEKVDGSNVLVRNYAIDYDYCNSYGTVHNIGIDWDGEKYTFDNYFEVNFGTNALVKEDPRESSSNGSAHKLYAATQSATVADMEGIYNYKDNDRITIENISTPEYLKITGSQDTVKISLQAKPNFYLYEQGRFLGMEHVADADMKAAILADTAYVRYNTYRPQYLLAVDTKIVEPVWDNHPNNPEIVHLITPDTVYGRFLVNMVDSAYAYGINRNSNPYIWDNNTYYRLAFIDGYHTNDKLYLNTANAKTTIDLSNNSDKVCTFAFRYVDETREGVKIETAYGPADANGNRTRGWLKYQNNVPVVTKDYNDAHVFLVDNTTTDAPTANENIAAGSVVVAGANGAVVVKGAEGKNVIVSTILGKVVANEVVSSDNATIAAPQGVVVVSVDGESFKVVVK